MSKRFGGESTGQKIRVEDGSLRVVYQGERGGHFYIYRGQRVNIPRPGLSVAIPVVHVGSLTQFGYSMREPARDRQRALRKAAQFFGVGETERKVNALYVFNKNRHPSLARIAQSDKAFLHRL
jgi:hypothetical protein